ncbi:MAG TPA: hypothetical protein VLT89_03510 [Usitatibacter sp.]|nr:hypothetical protein [Usitatibacter sp.]
MIRATILAATLSSLLALGAQAQMQGAGQGGPGMQGGPGGGPHHGPPPEAIEACSGKTSGATCSFMGREGHQVSGTCFSPPPKGDGSSGAKPADAPKGPPPMACRPEQRGGPGPEGKGGK